MKVLALIYTALHFVSDMFICVKTLDRLIRLFVTVKDIYPLAQVLTSYTKPHGANDHYGCLQCLSVDDRGQSTGHCVESCDGQKRKEGWI